jgi:hypothetical protein
MKVLVAGSGVIGTATARPVSARDPEIETKIDISGLARARYRSGFGG